MKVYKPVFDRKWEIVELESDLLERFPFSKDKVCYYKKNVGFYGPVYNTANIFKTREAAQRWIWGDANLQEELFYK